MINFKYIPSYIFYIAIVIYQRNCSVISSKSSITTTNSYAFRHTIMCSCLMNDMEESELLKCPTPYKLNIVYAYLFDSGEINEKDNCTSKFNDNEKIIKEITNDIKTFCSSFSSCQITKSFIINSKGDYLKIDCLSLHIVWSCESTKSSSPSSNYNFTYFFYIITLIFSSSCILVGSLFVLRRFIIMRRRNHLARSRECYASNGYNQRSNSQVWTTSSYGPPDYANIYDSSLPVISNIPPPYEIVKNKKEEANILFNNSNDTDNSINRNNLDNNSSTPAGVMNEANLSENNHVNNVEQALKSGSQLDIENINVNTEENKNISNI